MDSINQRSSLIQRPSFIQPSLQKPQALTKVTSKNTKSDHSDRRKVNLSGSINVGKIELKSQFPAQSQINPSFRTAPSSSSLSSPSQNLIKVSGPSKPNSVILKMEKPKKVNLNKVAVPVLYSLKELGLKKKKLREKSRKIMAKNNHSPTSSQMGIGNRVIKEIIEHKSKAEPITTSNPQEMIASRPKSQNSTKAKPLINPKAKIQQNLAIDPKAEFKFQDNLQFEHNRFKSEKTTVVDDDDSDIEVEEINIISQGQTEQNASEMGATQSIVISGIMKQVEELETTLKMNVAKKESELEVERQIVEQMKRKNEILELRDKKRKEAMEKQIVEAAKEMEKKNNEIDALKSFGNSMSQKLNKKEEEIGTMQSTVKKHTEVISRKLFEKQDELLMMSKKCEKVTSELKDLQNWKATQIVKEKESMKKLIQGNLAKDSIYKQRIDALEKGTKEKDDLIMKHERSIESLNVKIGEKEQLIKDMKLKVSKLISEFTKGFNDKEELLKSKIYEIQQSTLEIENLKSKISGLKENAYDKVKEIEKKDQMNMRQASIIQELSKKLDVATNNADQMENLHSARQEAAKTFIKGLEKRNSEKDLIANQLKTELIKLKTIKAKGLVINNEDIFEDKLEQFVYEFYGKKDADKPLMLTYLWPVFSVHVDPCLLKESEEDSKEKLISQVNIQATPLMLTYLWPVLPFQPKSQISTVSFRGLKRKISHIYSGKRAKLSGISFNIPCVIPVSFLKTVEQIPILNDLSDDNEVVTGGNPNAGIDWPIVAYDQTVNRKRKIEDFIQNNAKRIKLDSELKAEVNRLTSTILDELVGIAHLTGKHSTEIVKDIIAEIVEASAKSTTKIWPLVEYRGPTTVEGKMNISQYTKRSNMDIDKIVVSRQEILQLLPYFQVKTSFFDTMPKELIFKDETLHTDKARKSPEIVDKIWPVVLYQENIISQIHYSNDNSDEHNDGTLNDVLDHWNNVGELLNETLDYALSFGETKDESLRADMARKLPEIVDKIWPVMPYQENIIWQSKLNFKISDEKRTAIDNGNKFAAVEDNNSKEEHYLSNEDLDTSLEMKLKETVFGRNNMKRKFGEDPHCTPSKRSRLSDHEENSDEVNDDDVHDHWKIVDELLNESLEYSLS